MFYYEAQLGIFSFLLLLLMRNALGTLEDETRDKINVGGCSFRCCLQSIKQVYNLIVSSSCYFICPSCYFGTSHADVNMQIIKKGLGENGLRWLAL